MLKDSPKCSASLKRCKIYFTHAGIRSVYNACRRPKWEYSPYVCVQGNLTITQTRMGDKSVFKIFDIFSSIGVMQAVLYVQDTCAGEICPRIKSFNRTIQLSQASRLLLLELSAYCTTNYRVSSFVNHSAYRGNVPDICISQSNVYKH